MEKRKVLKLRSWVLAVATAVCSFVGMFLMLMGAWRYDLVGKTYLMMGFLTLMVPLLLAMVEIKVEK